MSLTQMQATEIADNHQKIHPNFGVLVTGSTYSKHQGKKLLDLDFIRIYTFHRSNSTTSMSSDEFKSKMFVWVYDTKNDSIENRRDFIFEKLTKAFPQYKAFVSISSTPKLFSSRNAIAFAHYKDCGGDVILALY